MGATGALGSCGAGSDGSGVGAAGAGEEGVNARLVGELLEAESVLEDNVGFAVRFRAHLLTRAGVVDSRGAVAHAVARVNRYLHYTIPPERRDYGGSLIASGPSGLCESERTGLTHHEPNDKVRPELDPARSRQPPRRNEDKAEEEGL